MFKNVNAQTMNFSKGAEAKMSEKINTMRNISSSEKKLKTEVGGGTRFPDKNLHQYTSESESHEESEYDRKSSAFNMTPGRNIQDSDEKSKRFHENSLAVLTNNFIG